MAKKNGLVIDHGNHIWYKDGIIHRDDGPAMIQNGIKKWMKDGKRHRLDGPAITWPDGSQFYYIYDVEYTKSEFKFWSKVFTENTETA